MNVAAGIWGQLAKGAAWVTVGKLLAAVFGLLLNAMIARLLSPEEVGAYFLGLSIATMAALFGQFGLNRGVVKLVAGALAEDKREKVRRLVYGVFAIGALGGLILLAWFASPAAGWVLAKVFASEALVALSVVIGVWSLALLFQGLVAETYRGFHAIGPATLYGGLLAALLGSVSLALVWFGQVPVRLEQVALIVVAVTGLSTLIGGAYLVKRIIHFPRSSGEPVAGELFHLGWPLLMASVATFGLREFQLWTLAVVGTAEDVALFGASMRLANLMTTALVLFNAVVPPMVAAAYARQDFRRLEELLRVTAALSALPAIAVLLVLLLVAGDVLGVVYGDFYVQAQLTLIIMAGAQAVNVLTGSPGVLLTMSGGQKVVMRWAAISGAAGVAVVIMLAPVYGHVGAATGFAVSIVLHNVGMWLHCKRHMQINTLADFRRLVDLWHKARIRVECAAHNGLPLGRLNRLLAPLERLAWRLRGKRLVCCFGDPNAIVFRMLNADQRFSGTRFQVVSVRGATAFGLGNPNSQTNALQVFQDELARLQPAQPILFMMGEVDAGFLIWLRAKTRNRSVESCMADALQRYTSFLAGVHRDHPSLIVSAAPLPTIPDGEIHGKVANARREVDASQRARTDLTLEFNRRLKDWCTAHGVCFLDLDAYSLDEKTGLVSAGLLNRNPGDHHYNQAAFADLIHKALLAMQRDGCAVSILQEPE